MKSGTLGLAACAVLVLGACGDDDEPDRAATTPTAAPTAAAPATTATTAPTTPSGEGQARDEGGDEEPVRIPATFTLRGGRLRPRTVSVPPYLAVEVSVTSRDRVRRLVTVRADRPYRLLVRPGRRTVRLIPGQRPGDYPVVVAGGGRATLHSGGEPGP